MNNVYIVHVMYWIYPVKAVVGVDRSIETLSMHKQGPY